MFLGTRVCDAKNHRRTGTVVWTDWKTDGIKWDSKSAYSVVTRTDVEIIGFDPSVGSKYGVMRDRVEENRTNKLKSLDKAMAG